MSDKNEKNLKNNIQVSHHPRTKASITFDEGPHTYTDNTGKIYESGTTFVTKYFEKFDAVAVSEMCSQGDNPKYAGRSSSEIQFDWSIDGEIAAQEGTNTHLYFEGLMSDWSVGQLPEPLSERCRLMFIQAEKAAIDVKKYYMFVGAEIIIFSPKLGKSGMIDLLVWSESSNEIVIFDLKTNKKIKRENKYRTALPPINHLDDTELSKYSLQLSLYQKILTIEKYFNKKIKFRRALIHLSIDDFKIINIEDYSDEINKLLKYEGILK